MPYITVATSVVTRVEVPEGVTIEEIRRQALPPLSEDEEATDLLSCKQQDAIQAIYMGAADPISVSVEHRIIGGLEA